MLIARREAEFHDLSALTGDQPPCHLIIKNVSSKNKGRCRDGAVCLKGIANHLAEKP